LKGVALSQFDLFPVIYSRSEQEQLVRTLVSSMWRSLMKRVDAVPDDEQEALAQVAARVTADHLWLLAPRLKSVTFETEEEWRLITYDVKGDRVPERPELITRAQFRIVGQRIVPYVTLTFESVPLDEIIVGASASMSPEDPGFSILWEETLDKPLTVSRSLVPVR
jgi:hypothetical protein